MVSPEPALSVVVLSYRNEKTILAAVDSLLDQDEPVEVVVSHSGGGDTPALLRRCRPGVRVEGSAARRLPGAARNAGIAASRAPFVAFLAGDCRASPGWAAERMKRHRAGALAVACAMAPAGEPRAPSLASHLLQHSDRMSHVPAAPYCRFGVS